MEKEPKTFFVDYRFIVKADTPHEAVKKVEQFLPEATSEIWYTIAREPIEKKSLLKRIGEKVRKTDVKP